MNIDTSGIASLEELNKELLSGGIEVCMTSLIVLINQILLNICKFLINQMGLILGFNVLSS